MLLAVDTSTPQIGLALYDGVQVLAESLWTSKARHTVELAPAVVEMLARTGLKMDALKALGVAIGPGSFTSLRVGLSFVKGLALARMLPIVGINTLEVVAASQPVSTLPLACLLPAGRGRLALGWYYAQHNGWQAAGEAVIVTAEALSTSIEQDSVICGDLSASERQILQKNEHIRLVSPALSTRRPAILADLAFSRWQPGRIDDAATLAPLYLHIGEALPG
ncbi:MAG: tRNA (adenosine(37)-N6)-threonylcarbamoyltransferase complex dimerization subunit type 1 TsaB [Chloroflexi bacterium]|nr:tRNA (adenosine(37)-N6)-threonylcarbamoyltransferase complex dimerization subunit type 1 TsaB [Chloroflexota bacterium]